MSARLGWTFKATTQEPQKGSTQRSNSCAWASLLISPTSFVLMPWHFSGGTRGGRFIRFPPRPFQLRLRPVGQFPFRERGVCPCRAFCIRGRFSNWCTVVRWTASAPCRASGCLLERVCVCLKFLEELFGR